MPHEARNLSASGTPCQEAGRPLARLGVIVFGVAMMELRDSRRQIEREAVGTPPPKLPKVPVFSQVFPLPVKHPLLYQTQLAVSDMKRLMGERDAIFLRVYVFGLTKEERLILWQAEYDKRTLLRPAAPSNYSSQSLLRAV